MPPEPKISYNPSYNPFRATPTQTHLHLEKDLKGFNDIKDFKDLKDPKDLRDLRDLKDFKDLNDTTPQSLPTSTCLQVQNKYIRSYTTEPQRYKYLSCNSVI